MKRLMTVLMLLMACVCAAVTIPGEIAHYPLHDGTGKEAKEAQGRMPAATIADSFWLVKDGLSLIDFGGMKKSREARITFPAMELDGEFTIALWISAYWWRDNWSPIFFRSDATYGIRNNRGRPGQIHFRVKDRDAKKGANLFSNAMLDTNRWYHVTAVFKPGKYMRLYIDGELDSELTMKVPVHPGTDKSRFRMGRGNKQDSYAGVISDLHIFNRALEESEIQALWKSENRFSLSVNRERLFPADGKVAASIPGADVYENGALRLTGGKTPFQLNSIFSYPQEPFMEYNLFSAAPAGKCEALWKPQVKQDKDGISVTAFGAHYRLDRRILSLGEGRVRIQDKVTNLTKEDRAVVFRHFLSSAKPFASWYLHGEEGARSASDTRLPPSNPTGWVSLGDEAMAWVVEDDILRCHLDASVEKNNTQFGSRRIGVPAGKSHTFEYTFYPMKGDYFDFINRLRKDWNIPVMTLPGPFITVRTAAQRCEVYKGLAANPAKMKAYFQRRNAGTFTLNPWFNYWDGNVFINREEYKVHMQKVMKTIRQALPDANFLASLETYCYHLGEEDFTTPAPQDFSWEKVTPGTQARVKASPWIDSTSLTSTGNISLYPESPVTGQRRNSVRLMVHPLIGNQLYKRRLDEIRFLLDEVGLSGIYQDMFGYSSVTSIIHDRWDGFSISVTPNGKISSKYAHLGPLTAPAREEWLKAIVSRKKLALTNFGAPTTRNLQSFPYMNFCEAAGNGVGRQNLTSIPPDSSGCAMNQLSTPLAYGPHRSEECDATRLMARVRAYLRYGCLYIHTSVRNSFPSEGEGSGEYGPINHMYPITPIELHRGWVKGRERIVSCVSYTTTWDRQEKPVALRFDAVGRDKPVGTAAVISGRPGAWEITVKIDDWKEFLIIE